MWQLHYQAVGCRRWCWQYDNQGGTFMWFYSAWRRPTLVETCSFTKHQKLSSVDVLVCIFIFIYCHNQECVELVLYASICPRVEFLIFFLSLTDSINMRRYYQYIQSDALQDWVNSAVMVPPTFLQARNNRIEFSILITPAWWVLDEKKKNLELPSKSYCTK